MRNQWALLFNAKPTRLQSVEPEQWGKATMKRARHHTSQWMHSFLAMQSESFTLSVHFNGKVRHFAIKHTTEGRYNIGQYDFKTLLKVVKYYQRHPLFHDNNQSVSLTDAVSVGTQWRCTWMFEGDCVLYVSVCMEYSIGVIYSRQNKEQQQDVTLCTGCNW